MDQRVAGSAELPCRVQRDPADPARGQVGDRGHRRLTRRGDLRALLRLRARPWWTTSSFPRQHVGIGRCRAVTRSIHTNSARARPRPGSGLEVRDDREVAGCEQPRRSPMLVYPDGEATRDELGRQHHDLLPVVGLGALQLVSLGPRERPFDQPRVQVVHTHPRRLTRLGAAKLRVAEPVRFQDRPRVSGQAV